MPDTIEPALKRRLFDLTARLFDGTRSDVETSAEKLVASDSVWHASHPLNTLQGTEAFLSDFLEPLRAAFPDLERRDHMFIAGTSNGHAWVGGFGLFVGTFTRDWLGIPATNRFATVRFGEFRRLENGVIVEGFLLFDLLDLMLQAGVWPLPKSLGAEAAWTAPMAQHALLLGAQDEHEGQKTIDLAWAMAGGLLAYDQKSLASMGQDRFWHPQMTWFGPAGIGTARGLRGFQTHHQVPFLEAFPDRQGGHHQAAFGEGHYAGWVGWPSVKATHTGGSWLGLAPTGRPVTMRVMDFYWRDGDRLRENWVFIDIIDVCRQLGIDLLERMARMKRS
ncbi:MAG: ester cyclase [Geminicoccaceae bacterium]